MHPPTAHPYKWAFNNKSKELEQLNNSKRNQRKRQTERSCRVCGGLRFLWPFNIHGWHSADKCAHCIQLGCDKSQEGLHSAARGHIACALKHSANTHTASEQKSIFSAFCADSVWKESFVAARMIWKYCACSRKDVFWMCVGANRERNQPSVKSITKPPLLLFSLFPTMLFHFIQKEIWLKTNAEKGTIISVLKCAQRFVKNTGKEESII